MTKLKPILIGHFENPRSLKNYAQSTHPVPYKWNNKVWMTAVCLQHGSLNILSSLLRFIAQKKKKKERESFQTIIAH